MERPATPAGDEDGRGAPCLEIKSSDKIAESYPFAEEYFAKEQQCKGLLGKIMNTNKITQFAKASKLYSILILLSIVTLTLLYSGLVFFGPINDLINAAAGGTLFMLALHSYKSRDGKLPTRSLLSLLAAGVAAILVAGNSIMVALGQLHWQEGAIYTAIGYGFAGLWLLSDAQSMKQKFDLPEKLIRLGRFVGLALSIGILAIIQLFSREAAMSILGYLAMSAIAIGWVLLPWWTFKVSKAIN